jgi:hypothetical protein
LATPRTGSIKTSSTRFSPKTDRYPRRWAPSPRVVAEAAASATAETNPFERASVGQPVQIVWDVATGPGGGRLSAGVVCYAEGSRIHVVEPRRGDAFAPGLASTGLAETAEWVAMGLHKDALDRAIRAKRVEPRQSGPGYLVLEFALCSDGRWHKCDAFGP